MGNPCVPSTMELRFCWFVAAHRYLPLLKLARISAARYRKASSMAMSSSVRGMALASQFVMVMWLMAPPYILNPVWRLASRMVRLKSANPIAKVQRHTRFRLGKSRSREREQWADKHSPRTWNPHSRHMKELQ